MNCTNCGKPIATDTRFCPTCGTQVDLVALAQLISDTDPRVLAIEKALGNKYRILRKIGSGGFADVFLGEHVQLGRKVAVKILLASFTKESEMVERFRRESKAAAKLSHPNIIDIYDVGESEGVYYFVMKCIEGDTLGKKMHKEGRIEPSEAIDIIRQLADALAYAHANNVIHRDMKPANVMIDEFGKPVLMDFGIARVQFGENLTRTGTLMGTPHYLPPEQPLGKGVDGRSDIYSLGIMFYEMLCGRVPFHDDTPIALIYKHINEPPRPLQELVPELDPGLCYVVHKMIEKLPERRYQSALEVVEVLEPLAAAYPGPTPAARRSSPGAQSTEKLYLLAEEHLKGGQFSKALDIFKMILQRNPDDVEARKKIEELVTGQLNQVQQDLEEKKIDRAKERLTQLQTLIPQDDRLNSLRREVERAEQKSMKDSQLKNHYDAARRALEHDNAAGAMDHLTKALTVDPENEEAQTLLRTARAAYEKNRSKAEFTSVLGEAEYHFNNGSYEVALSTIQRALQIESNFRAKELQEKIQTALKEKTARQSEQERTSKEVDQLCENLDFEGAQQLLAKIKSSFPAMADSKAAAVERSRTLYQKIIQSREAFHQNRLEDSATHYQEFLRVAPPYDYQAFYELRKEAEDSLKLIEERLAHAQLDQQLKKADVFLRMGQIVQAKEECRRILERNPQHPGALSKLKEIESALEQQRRQQQARPQQVPEPVADEGGTVQIPTPAKPAPPAERPSAFVRQDPAPRPQPAYAPQPSTRLAMPPAQASRPSMMTWVLGGAGVLVIAVIALVFLWPKPQPQGQAGNTQNQTQNQSQHPPTVKPTVESISVSIDSQPWTNIEVTGKNLKQKITETTPAVLRLPAGQYTIIFQNPDAGRQGMSRTIDVSQYNREFTYQFTELVDPNKLADTIVR